MNKVINFLKKSKLVGLKVESIKNKLYKGENGDWIESNIQIKVSSYKNDCSDGHVVKLLSISELMTGLYEKFKDLRVLINKFDSNDNILHISLIKDIGDEIPEDEIKKLFKEQEQEETEEDLI